MVIPQQALPGRLVVLGGSGFVGRSLVARAKERGIDTVSLASRDVDLCAGNAGVTLAGMLAPEDCLIFCSAIDNGARTGSDAFIRNMLMARSVAEAATRTPPAQLVYLSSESVYPYEEGLISEATPAAPATLYGAMHRAREIILAAETRVPLAVLRLTGIYGNGDTHNAYGPNRFLRQAVQEGKITLFGHGEEMRDHLYVDDAAELVLEAVCRRFAGTLNLATGRSVSFQALAQRIAAKTGARIETAPRRQPVTHRHFDVTRRLTAFPSFVPAEIEQMLDKHDYSIMQRVS